MRSRKRRDLFLADVFYLVFNNRIAMRNILFIFPVALIVLFSFSCSKNNDKGCWQAFHPGGADVEGLVLCDQTRSQAEAQYPQYWFYSADEAKYCWVYITSTGQEILLRHIPTSMVERMGINSATTSTIDCNSFCVWNRIIEKHKSKVTGLFGPTKLYSETFGADSCSTLFVGRVVVHRETADSLITREFMEKLP
jgi:hypothetical protein